MTPPGEFPPDRALVERARGGDAEAFNQLVIRHQDRIYSAILRFCGDPEDARDVSQRAFVNAWRKVSEFKGDAAFSTWMYRIAFNQAISFRREGGRARTVSIHGREEGAISEPVDDRRPGDRLEGDENRRKVQEALALLDPEDRKVLILRELEDRSYDEIAAILEVPKGTVRSRLFRARQALKEKLKILIGSPAG